MPETNFYISTMYIIIDNLKAEMSRRGQVCNDTADRFSCLVNVPETSSTMESVEYSGCCEEIINVYPEELNSNLFSQLQQFHSYIRQKLSAKNQGMPDSVMRNSMKYW